MIHSSEIITIIPDPKKRPHSPLYSIVTTNLAFNLPTLCFTTEQFSYPIYKFAYELQCVSFDDFYEMHMII